MRTWGFEAVNQCRHSHPDRMCQSSAISNLNDSFRSFVSPRTTGSDGMCHIRRVKGTLLSTCNSPPKTATWLLISTPSSLPTEDSQPLHAESCYLRRCNLSPSVISTRKIWRMRLHLALEGYGYQITDDSMIPQLLNSAMCLAC